MEERMKPMSYTRIDPEYFRNVNDVEKDDPIQVDGVLSEELMKLSVQARNDFQEEIHGVRCLAPTETPELLSQSLDQLQLVLDHQIPSHEKQAYIQSQKPQLGNHKRNSNPKTTRTTTTYVNTKEFRLRFLRCELFDVSKAALRLVRFLDLVLDLFGDYALQRPIRLTDFSKYELKHIRKGRYQFLPYRDRGGIAGRRVLCVFPDEEWELIPPYLRNKILIYHTWVAGNDIDVQREGLIFLVWFDGTFKVSPKPAIQAKDHETVTVRASGIHCCSPDTPIFRFRRSIMTMRIGRHNRTKLNIHLGESVELRYKLNAFGLPSDQIPITFSGKIKCVYLKQWLKVRQRIEEAEADSNHVFNCNSASDASDSASMPKSTSIETSQAESMIESPYLSDIIFRKGASLVSHAGNAALRTLVVTKARSELMNPSSSPTKMGRFVEEIIQELRQTGLERAANGSGKPCRFLVWDEGGWWTELFQEHDIHTRVEYIARGIRNTVIKNHKACSLFAKSTKVSSSNTTNTITTTTMPADEATTNGKPPTIPNSKPHTRAVTLTSPTSSASSSRATTPEPRQIAIDTIISPLPVPPTTKNTATGSNPSHNGHTTATTNSSINSSSSSTNNSTIVHRASKIPKLDDNEDKNNNTTFANLMLAPSMMQHQHGGTSIFRSLDHSSGPSLAAKKRPVAMMSGEDSDLGRPRSSSDMCEAECFGMKFNSTNRWL